MTVMWPSRNFCEDAALMHTYKHVIICLSVCLTEVCAGWVLTASAQPLHSNSMTAAVWSHGPGLQSHDAALSHLTVNQDVCDFGPGTHAGKSPATLIICRKPLTAEWLMKVCWTWTIFRHDTCVLTCFDSNTMHSGMGVEQCGKCTYEHSHTQTHTHRYTHTHTVRVLLFYK